LRLPHFAYSRIRVFVPTDAAPTTQRAQLDNLFAQLGVTDFHAAATTIDQWRAASQALPALQTERQALFEALGGSGTVPDHYDFATAISGLRTAQQGLFTALGVDNSEAAVAAVRNLTSQVNSLSANQTTLFAALGATDLAGAMRAVKDVDGRIEAGVASGIIARAASAGLTTPLEKPNTDAGNNPAAAGGTKSITRAQWAQMNSKQQLEFSQAGGVVTAEAA
jgi:hypothetical protein